MTYTRSQPQKKIEVGILHPTTSQTQLTQPWRPPRYRPPAVSVSFYGVSTIVIHYYAVPTMHPIYISRRRHEHHRWRHHIIMTSTIYKPTKCQPLQQQHQNTTAMTYLTTSPPITRTAIQHHSSHPYPLYIHHHFMQLNIK